jgi:hypothetical protein
MVQFPTDVPEKVRHVVIVICRCVYFTLETVGRITSLKTCSFSVLSRHQARRVGQSDGRRCEFIDDMEHDELVLDIDATV